MDKVLKELEESLVDAYDYLSKYANEYLEEDSCRRIEKNAKIDDVSLEQYLWQAVYDVVMEQDNSAEYETWYASWLKEAINLINKYK